MTGASATHARPWLDVYLGLFQFLFLLAWIVYVIFLPDLLARAGLPKDFAPRLLIADQLLFAGLDVVLGLFADRAMNQLRRLTPIVLVLNLLACLIFVALPHLAGVSAILLIGATMVWVATSTVLRAPLYGAIARRCADPLHGGAWALAGLGLASAAAPYLGIALKGMDPALPMLVSGIVLALATLGFGAWEQAQPETPRASPTRAPVWSAMRLPGATLLLLGAGFQLHFFMNAAPLFKQATDPALLPWLMPVFWVGFSLAVYPGAKLITRQGAARTLATSAAVGALASLACAMAPGVLPLVGLQALAGAAWGISFLAALELAGQSGHHGSEATFIGLVFAALALATALRIGLGAASPSLVGGTSQLLAPGLWGLGALLAVYLATSSRQKGIPNEPAQH